MATSKIGGGLKLVAKRAFEDKVRKLANPTRKTETYVVTNGKVNGVPLNILLDAITAAKNHFTHTGDKLYIAKR